MLKLILSVANRVFNKIPSLKQFIKFALVGFSNTITDFIVYYLLTRLIFWFGHYYLVANMISFTVAVTQSFFINKRWTFRQTGNDNFRRQYVKFFLVNLLALSVNQFLFYLLVETAQLHDLFAKVLLVISNVLINFTLAKFWVFKG